MPSSSFSSRISAASGVSPACSLPPGNSHSPAIVLPSGRRASSTRPSASISAQAATSSSGLLRGIRCRRPAGFGVAEDVVARRLEAPDRMLPAARQEVIGPLAGLAEADAAQHRGRGRIVGGDARFQPVQVEIGQRPARQPAGRLGRDPMAPEAPPNPVARAGRTGPGIDMQADDADQHLVLALPPGDRQVIGAAAGEFACRVDRIQSSASSRG